LKLCSSTTFADNINVIQGMRIVGSQDTKLVPLVLLIMLLGE